jgi:hypothetical protein
VHAVIGLPPEIGHEELHTSRNDADTDAAEPSRAVIFLNWGWMRTLLATVAWKGGPPLQGSPGSPEFVASYNAAVRGGPGGVARFR